MKVMFYIVGLGNPGAKYEATRHNVGFMVLDTLVKQYGFPKPHTSAQYAGLVSEGVLAGSEVQLLWPQTYMNHSGSAVQKLVSKTEANNLIVVYDDVDIPLGEVKVSFGRGDGGHNGIKSIVSALGTKEFVRVRVGVAGRHFWTGKPVRPKGANIAKHVLGAFGVCERRILEPILSKASEAVLAVIEEGYVAAMNRFN